MKKFLIKSLIIREWASGKLVEYESLRISNGRVESGRVSSKIVKLRVDMRVYRINFLFFNCEYHAIIEIVKCESARVAKKWSSASRLCEYAGTRPFPRFHINNKVSRLFVIFPTQQEVSCMSDVGVGHDHGVHLLIFHQMIFEMKNDMLEVDLT